MINYFYFSIIFKIKTITMIDTAELIRRITEYINSQPDDISKKELKKAIGDIYDELTKTEKKAKKTAKSSDSENDEKPEKKTRTITKYNAFMKEKMAYLKENETPDNKMNAKEKMLHIAKLWREEKEAKKADVDSEAGEANTDVEKPKGKTPRAGMGVKKGK
jgi:hypothetical protein